MNDSAGASATITDEVTSWPGVHAGVGERGEWGFKVGRREIGHLHGDRVAHFGFPRSIWTQLLEEGRIGHHPIDRPGWGARALRDEADITDVIALMRLNYDRVVERYGLPIEAEAS